MFDSPGLRFVKNVVAINVLGSNCFCFNKRSGNKSLLGYRISDDLLDGVSRLLDEQNIPFVQKRNRIKDVEPYGGRTREGSVISVVRSSSSDVFGGACDHLPPPFPHPPCPISRLAESSLNR